MAAESVKCLTWITGSFSCETHNFQHSPFLFNKVFVCKVSSSESSAHEARSWNCVQYIVMLRHVVTLSLFYNDYLSEKIEKIQRKRKLCHISIRPSVYLYLYIYLLSAYLPACLPIYLTFFVSLLSVCIHLLIYFLF